MKNKWQVVKLGSFLRQSYNSVEIDPNESYLLLGMSLEGRGLFVRENKLGSEIGAKWLNKVIPGEFIYSRLFAWKGAFDYVKSDFECSFVSDEYPTFSVDKTVIDVRFLYYYFKRAKIWKQVEEYCIGVTKASRNRFKEKYFLEFEINLPPLPEQQQIVSRIERINTKLGQIRKLRAEQEREIGQLLYSKYREVIKGAKWLPMSEVAPIHRRKVEIDPDKIYHEIGVRSFGRGLFEKASFKGIDLTWQQPYWMKEGDLLFSNIKAWEGAVGLIPKQYDCWVGSHRYITCLPNLKLIESEFLYYYFKTQEGVEKLKMASPGTADRNRTLNTKKLEKILIPVPDKSLQNEFLGLLNRVEEIKYQHNNTQLELNDLLPSLLNITFPKNF